MGIKQVPGILAYELVWVSLWHPRLVVIIPLYTPGSRDTERLSNLHEVTQPGSSGARIGTQLGWMPSDTL